ncbi:hypothetical protein BKA56DRAFT_668063 [Ilyonectria sp. MPI-CAGE-AT-0026]|nr:hypothetical protein BKA56DRAFT_668063 [Ilyonectria sp. MPI-CAGE-AT-0026]
MAEDTVKPTRTSKSKVRTGCITCKIRRIKCDESKPACIRCTSTGRKCDGYVSARTPAAGPRSPAKLACTEARAQEFFYHKTVPELSGFFGRPFWNTVLQFSLTEPSIRHASVALATLHEVHSTPLSLTTTNRDSLKFAIQSYNRAISTLRKRASDPASTPLVALASIIFTCFECLWGDPKAAAAHVTSGIGLLRMWRDKSGEPISPWGQHYRSFEFAFIETYLAPVLCTLSLCVAEFSFSAAVYLNPLDVKGCPAFEEPFQEISQARVGLIDIITAAVRLSQEGSSRSQAGNRRACLRATLECWKTRFDDLIQRRESSWSDQDRGAADLVRVMWESTTVGLSVGAAADETAWDAHKTAYEEIIRVVESLIARQGDLAGSANFHFEMGVISPLHLVAWKCRWPHLRRKGLALLLSSSRRECLYDSKLYHAVFSRIMAIEEAHSEEPLSKNSDLCDLPPEQARIHHFFCEPASSTADGVYHLKLLSRLNWPESTWHLQTEYLPLGSSQASCDGNSLSFTSPLLARLPVVDLFRTGPVPTLLLESREAQVAA